MHHTNPLGVYQTRMVGMMLQFSPGELRARAALMHHADKGHSALKHHAAFKGLITHGQSILIDYSQAHLVPR